jgi:hypothetical protein
VTGWVKALIGALLIGGILAGVWAVSPLHPVPAPEPTPAAPELDDAHAAVVLRRSDRVQRAAITCDGDHRTATGFWAGDVPGACSALAGARNALLAGPGCPEISPRQMSLHVTGAFGSRRFDHQVPFGGCPDDADWLAVNVFASPVLGPQRAIDDAR